MDSSSTSTPSFLMRDPASTISKIDDDDEGDNDDNDDDDDDDVYD